MSDGGGTPFLTYRSAGVDYEVLDAAKRASLEAAAGTLRPAGSRGVTVLSDSIGEPAALIKLDDRQLAVVLECLGTKSVIAREVQEALGVDRFFDVGVDAVAAIVNDLCCVGALPVTLNAYFSTGSADWYSGSRHSSLVSGWAAACEVAGAAWVGGESPSLAGVVEPDEIDIAGSALGLVPRGRGSWQAGLLEAGDEIVLVASSGLHANGASLARKVASELEEGWSTRLAGGRRLGEAVLEPSVIYVGLVEALHGAGADVHYASHVTGHGLRKLMRAGRELTYRVFDLPPVPEVLSTLAELAGLDATEAYATFNMGVGFAVYVASGAGKAVVDLAGAKGYEALLAGKVEAGKRRVVLEPVGVSYASEALVLR
ncbi:MAG: AIR synthase-related protein [Acidimicrobiales bacterium]